MSFDEIGTSVVFLLVRLAKLLVSGLIAFSLLAIHPTAYAETGDELAEPENPLVIIFHGGRWEEVRSIEVRGGAIIYQRQGGTLVSAPLSMVNQSATEATNGAIVGLFEVCASGARGEIAWDDLNTTAWAAFQSIGKKYLSECLSRPKVLNLVTPKSSNQETAGILISDETLLKTDRPSRQTDSTDTARPIPPPSPIDADRKAKALCAEQWGTNYQMRRYCLKGQAEALASLEQRYTVSHGVSVKVFNEIRIRCILAWPENLSMRNYCEKGQIEAYQELQDQ